MPRFVTHLEGAIDGERLPADKLASVHKDRPILVRYDLDAIGRSLTKETLRSRRETLWRYRELLPYFDDTDVVSLGESLAPSRMSAPSPLFTRVLLPVLPAEAMIPA